MLKKEKKPIPKPKPTNKIETGLVINQNWFLGTSIGKGVLEKYIRLLNLMNLVTIKTTILILQLK